MTYTIECVLECANHVGESPIWDVEEGRLTWVDSTGRRVGKPAIWRLDPRNGKVEHWDLDKDVGALVLAQGRDRAILALDDGFYHFNFSTGRTELIQLVDADQPRTRLNDGKCDRLGRFFAGGMDDKEEIKNCGLWRLDPDYRITQVDDSIICSNGPCWSPDNKNFYLADTFQQEIWTYDYDLVAGIPSNRRLFASTGQDQGVADGSTIDEEGFLWNAQLISGDLVRYAPDGTVERKITMPVRNITSVMFGGPRLDEIYVTSMARVKHPAVHDHFAAEMRPQFGAGHLFRISSLNIRGLPEPRFAG